MGTGHRSPGAVAEQDGGPSIGAVEDGRVHVARDYQDRTLARGQAVRDVESEDESAAYGVEIERRGRGGSTQAVCEQRRRRRLRGIRRRRRDHDPCQIGDIDLGVVERGSCCTVR